MVISSLHDAQAFEDSRQDALRFRAPPPLPLEARREQTENETWDDAVSLDEVTQASKTLAALTLSGTAAATCLAVDSKLIFVGTSDASVLLFDHFGVTRGVLEGASPASPSVASITSLDSYQNSLLLAGYSDGRVILWDVATSTRLLEVMGPSNIPISMVRWYKSNQLCVCIDAAGVANLFKFSKTFLISSYTADRKLLLDGRSRQGFGPIFATRVLTTDAAVGLAMTVASFTLIVRLEPEPTKIAFRWEPVTGALPEGLIVDGGEDGDDMKVPCLAFHPAAFVGQNRQGNPTIVRCSGRLIDFACLDQMLEVVNTKKSQFVPSNAIVACEWISDCSVSLLDSSYQFQMVDTVSNLVVGKCDATRVQLVKWPFPSHPDSGTFENSIRMFRWSEEANATLYLLGIGELVKIGIQPWSIRVDRFVKSGQWLEALTLSLKYYRTVLQPLESGEGGGDSDFKASGLMSAIRDGSRISELLKRYLQFHSDSLSADVGAICIEYSISIHRYDLIFEDLFDAFLDKNKLDELMSVLYPFVLAGKIQATLPPVVFDCLTQYISVHTQKDNLESLFLSLKQVPADLDGSIRLCKENKLLSALCRLYTEGLADFVSPVQIILGWMSCATTVDELRELGYRLFLYLSYCFLGVEFPKGNVPLSREKAELARVSLLSFIFPPTLPSLLEEAKNDPLFVCLDFDADTFMRVLEQASGFEQEYEILRWLMVAGLRPGIKLGHRVLDFVARHVSHMKKQSDDLTLEMVLTPLLAEQFFQHVYRASSPELCAVLIERFPRDPDWYLDQIARMASSSERTSPSTQELMMVATLKRLRLRDASMAEPQLFTEALDSILDLKSEQLIMDFILEQRERFGSEPWFSNAVSSRARRLLEVNSEQTSKLLLDLRSNVDLILKELNDDPASQFALLKPLVGARAFGEEVTQDMVATFVDLLCEREPDQAYEWLSKNEGRYSLDLALEACRIRGIDDATAYLLERAGRVNEALDLVLRNVTLDDLRKLEQKATVAINLCISFTLSKGKDEMWLRVLDAFMELSPSVSTMDQKQVFVRVVETIVDSMMPYVQLERVLERVRNLSVDSAEDSRPAVFGMLESFKREVSILKVANRALKEDMLFVERKKQLHRVKGTRIKASTFINSNITFVPVKSDQHQYSNAFKPHQTMVGNGFDNFEALELCWDALEDNDPQRLMYGLIQGTCYELKLVPEDAVMPPELLDAGL